MIRAVETAWDHIRRAVEVRPFWWGVATGLWLAALMLKVMEVVLR